MARGGKQRGARGDLDDMAEIHDRDPVGEVIDHGEVVGDEQEGQAAIFLDVLQEIEDLALDRYVERRQGFVGDDQFGLHHQGPGDGDALALAARKLMRVAVGIARVEAHLDHHGLDPVAPFRRRAEPVNHKRFADDGADRQAWVERAVRVLEHHLQGAARGFEFPALEHGEVRALEPDNP